MRTIILTALAAAAFALPLAAADVSGTWTFAGDVVGNAINMKCAFKQEGGKVTGVCTHLGHADSPTAGDVAGDKVTFQHKVDEYDLTFTGILDAAGTSMKGDIAVAGVAGTFSGTKDKEQ
jgi:hypothetical protein